MFDVEAAAKFDHEMLGMSLEDVAKRYNLPLALIQKTAIDQAWQPQVSAPPALQATSLEELAAQMIETARNRLNIVAVARQLENQAFYMQLEKACLEKALELIADLDSTDDKAAVKLRHIVSVMQDMKAFNPIMLVDQHAVATKAAASGGADNKINVYIQNNLDQ